MSEVEWHRENQSVAMEFFLLLPLAKRIAFRQLQVCFVRWKFFSIHSYGSLKISMAKKMLIPYDNKQYFLNINVDFAIRVFLSIYDILWVIHI